MGIIQRQSLKGILVFVIGAIIQFALMLFLMPKFLSVNDFAVFKVYFSLIVIFSAFGLMGIQSLVTKHLHDFENDAIGKQKFNFTTLFIVFCSALLMMVLIYTSQNIIYSIKKTDNPYLLNYFWCVPICSFFNCLIFYFEAYSIATHRLTAPSVVKEILLRIILLVAIFLYWKKIINTHQFFGVYAFSYAVGALILAIYCYAIRNFRIKVDFSFITSSLFKSFIPYAIFICTMSLLSALILNLDQPVVYSMLGSNGIYVYSIAITLSSMIMLPYKPISSILQPFLYASFKEKNFAKLNEINKQSSKYLTVLGTLLLLLLIANCNSLIYFIEHNANNTILLNTSFFKGALIIIGFGRVLDFTTGTSSEMLLASPTYKSMVVYMFVTFLFSLVCYKIFIPYYKEAGASLACLCTIILFNVLKYFHLYKKYGIQPIAIQSFIAIGIGAMIYYLQSWLPVFANIWIDIMVRSAIITIVYCAIIFALKLMPEINLALVNLFKKN